eukprot:jgi/Tetstr1/446595/TSEL_034120.t1
MTRARIAIAPSIFTITLVIAVGLAGAIISYTHGQNAKNAELAATVLMDRALETIDLRISALVEPIDSTVRQSRFWLSLNEPPSYAGHPLRAHMVSLLREMPQASSVFVGFEQGDHYQVASAAHRTAEVMSDRGAPPDTAYQETVILRSGRAKPLALVRFLDAQGGILATRFTPENDYDPRGRPWYELARGTDEVVRTDVYHFAMSTKLGVSVARRFEQGVVGVDVTLDELTAFLDAVPQARDGVVALFHDDGRILTHSKLAPRDAAGDTDAFGDRQEKLEHLVTRLAGDPLLRALKVDVGGHAWLVRRNPVDLGGGAAENLVVAMPRAAVVGPIEDVSQRTFLVSLLIVLASIPLIWLVSRRISRPIHALGEAAERIGRFELDREIPSGSVIREVDLLQRAMERMRRSLSMFSLYAPKTLVRQLVASETPPVLGGERREYFERATQILQAHGATIDKYIGDSVMAFWNAPMATQDHPAKACAAALEIIAETSALTNGWVDAGDKRVRTRIGIHCGQAIIGNVGSSDRMNYTALGNTVNLASRLEGLNRDLGTSILVSADMKARLEGRFRFRSAGATAIKGYEEPVPVFELLGALPDDK